MSRLLKTAASIISLAIFFFVLVCWGVGGGCKLINNSIFKDLGDLERQTKKNSAAAAMQKKFDVVRIEPIVP